MCFVSGIPVVQLRQLRVSQDIFARDLDYKAIICISTFLLGQHSRSCTTGHLDFTLILLYHSINGSVREWLNGPVLFPILLVSGANLENRNPAQSGRLAERTNAPHLKCGREAILSEVRILHLPPVGILQAIRLNLAAAVPPLG